MSASSPFAFDWVLRHAEATPDAPAIGTPARWTTYGELAGMVSWFAEELRQSGVTPGSFVVLSLPASPVAVAAVLAVQSLGACAVELNRESDPGALAVALEQTGARHGIVHARDASRWQELGRAHRLDHLYVACPASPPPALRTLLRDLPWTWVDERGPFAASNDPRFHRDPSAPALLVYTSGSTGTPRGVLQSSANVFENTRAICGYLNLTKEDRALSILPLFYCFGRSILQTHLFVGGSVFLDNRFMYPRVVMDALDEQKCTGFYGVPLTFQLLRRQVNVPALPRSTLRYVAQAGGAMAPDTLRWVRKAFAPAPLYVMYGQTEATARLSYLPPERAMDKAGSIGRGLENVQLRVVDPTGKELPVGEVGELVARGPSVTAGYLGAPEESAAILRDGWLWTGDLGWRDEEGFIFLAGRAKDMLKLSGHRVSAAEIERTLAEHPLVGEAAVVGKPHEIEGEVAIAFVVASGGSPPDPADLRRFCRQRLPAFKVPRRIHIVADLPRTSSGKISKTALREEHDGDDSILEGCAETGPGGEGD